MQQADQVHREPDVRGDLACGSLDELWEAVFAVHVHRPLPGQMVQPDVVEGDALRPDVQKLRELALESHRRVAQADRPMAVVEQGLHHDADRVGEVDQPRAASAAPLGLLGDVEHYGDRAQGFGESSRAGCLLSDAAELEWQRLVNKAGGLAADPELDDDEAGAVQRPLTVPRDDERARPFVLLENAPRQPPDHLEPLVVDVVQDELVDRQAVASRVESFDQLRRVCAAAADDCNLDAHSAASYARICGNC